MTRTWCSQWSLTLLGYPCVNNNYNSSLPVPVWTLVFVTRYEQILDKVLTDMKILLNKLGRYEEAVQNYAIRPCRPLYIAK